MNPLKKTGKQIEKLVREARLAPRVFLKYGTFKPTRVEMPNAAGPIFIDPADRRAKKKILFDSVRNRYSINRRFWVDFVSALEPDLALDIGVNYGECIFSPVYPDKVSAIGFEANPALFRHLNKSLAGARRIQVETQSVDAVLREKGKSPETLVFKIDVEGFEPQVLLGMTETLDHARLFAGFIEVDTRFLEKTGWPPERYDREILNRFDLYTQSNRKSMIFERIASLDSYCQAHADKKKHFDLLVFRKGILPESLPRGWTLQG